MRNRVLKSLLLLPIILALACQDYSNPAPVIDSVTPDEVPYRIRMPVAVQGRHFYAEVQDNIDTDDPPTLDTNFEIILGERTLAAVDVTFIDPETIDFITPLDLGLGTHNLTVITPGGRSATLEDALTVFEPLLFIEDSPGGAGNEIGDVQLAIGRSLALYSVARKAEGSFLWDQEATWSVLGDIGTLDTDSGTQAVFTATTIGTGRISAEHELFGSDLTGTISVVSCESDADCHNPTPICSSEGQCRACASDAECQALEPGLDRCDLSTGSCLPCLDHGDCGAPWPYCEPGTHACVECLEAGHCDDGNVCTDDTCVGFVCSHADNTAPCDDGLFCNGADACTGGVCTAHAGDPCPGTECNTCNEAADNCFDPPGTMCSDDGDPCTTSGRCASGVCTSGPADKDGDNDGYIDLVCGGDDCNDNDVGIHPGADDSDCDNVDDDCDGTTDGAYVPTATSCGTGVCAAAGQLECQTGVEVDTCAAGSPSEDPETTCDDSLDNDCDGDTDTADINCQACTQDSDCDNNDVCDGLETCVNFSCQAGTALVCDDNIDCTIENCDAVNGCQRNAAADGTACDEGAGQNGDFCDSSCLSGTCVETSPANLGEACDDGFDCTLGDACDGAGACLGMESHPYCDGIQSGDICWPGCSPDSSGCLTPPTGLTVTCEDPVTSPDNDSACDLTLTGGTLTDQAACLSCSVTSGESVRVFESTGFDDGTGADCDLNGWTLVADTGDLCSPKIQDCIVEAADQNCCATMDAAIQSICDATSFPGNPVLRTDKNTNCGGDVEEWRLAKTLDATGITGMAICFDYADANADDKDGVAVYVNDTANPTPVEVYCDVEGPARQVDGAFYWVCGDIPATFNNSPDLSVLFIMHSESNNKVVFIDDIELYGWIDGCAPDVRTALSDTFDDGAGNCDISNWTMTSGVPLCPAPWDCSGDRFALMAKDTAWTIETSVDATDLDGFVTLCFDAGTDGVNADDTVLVQFDAGGGWETAWASADRLGENKVCGRVCVNLSSINPAANDNAAMGIRFTLASIGGGDEIFIDDVGVTGFHYCSTGSADVSLSSPPVDQGGGVYQVTAANNGGTPATVDVQCVWDPDPSVAGGDSITFQ